MPFPGAPAGSNSWATGAPREDSKVANEGVPAAPPPTLSTSGGFVVGRSTVLPRALMSWLYRDSSSSSPYSSSLSYSLMLGQLMTSLK